MKKSAMNRRKMFFVAAGAVLALTGFARPSEPRCEIFEDGEFFVGCNYWARHAGMYMWSQWRPDVVEHELSELAKQGVTVMRVFPLWSDFQPLTGDCNGGGSYRSFRFRDNRPLPNWAGVDDEMIARFAWFCDCAERNGIKLIVGLVTGWMSGRQFVPGVFEEKNVLSDHMAVMWQTRFVKYFVEKLKGKRAIVAWDLGNECNCLGANGQAMFYNWMDHITMSIRSADATRPVVSGMHGMNTGERSTAPIRLGAEIVDVLCTHPYAYYVPGCGKEAFNTMRTELHPTAESLLYEGLGGKPCFVEEIGNLGTAATSDARTAAGMRATMFSAWANNLRGALWWCNSDQELLAFPPYELTANERELGLLRHDYSPKPVMLEMKMFQEFRKSLPFAKLPPRRTDAVIVVPEKTDGWISAFGAYLLCKQAGIDPVFAGAEHELPKAPLYIVCSGTTDASYTFRAQCRFFEKASSDGATVAFFYSARSRYTWLRKQAGVEVDYCCRTPSKKTFSIDAYPARTMTCGDDHTVKIIARECETLGRASDGEPVFMRFRNGKGKVYMINAPIDNETIARSDTVTGKNVEPFYLMLQEVAKDSGLPRRIVKDDCPYVGITEHPTADGGEIVVAINFEPRDVECRVAVDGAVGKIWRGDVTGSRIRLAANEAAVFEIKPIK